MYSDYLFDVGENAVVGGGEAKYENTGVMLGFYPQNFRRI